MVKQYPHTLIISTVSGNVQDANGNFSSGTGDDPIELECRAEITKGIVPGPNGTKISYNGIVYMPQPESDIKPGSQVEVQDENGNTILKDKVLQFYRGQLNARVWL